MRQSVTIGTAAARFVPRHGSCKVVSPAFPLHGRKDVDMFGGKPRPPSESSPCYMCAEMSHLFPASIRRRRRINSKNNPQMWGMTPRRDLRIFPERNTPHKCGEEFVFEFPTALFTETPPRRWGRRGRIRNRGKALGNTPAKRGRPPVKTFAPMPMHRTILESELACDLRQTVQHGGALGGLKPCKKLFT